MDVDTQPFTCALKDTRGLVIHVWTDHRVNILTVTEGDRHNVAIRLAEHVSILHGCPPSFRALSLMDRGLVCETVLLGLKELTPHGTSANALADAMVALGWPLAVSVYCRHEAEHCTAETRAEFLNAWQPLKAN